MKSLKSAVLLSVVIAGASLTGCSMNSYLSSDILSSAMNNASDLVLPIKVNDTLSVTKVNKMGNMVTLDVDLAKNYTGPIDKYVSSELQSNVVKGALCFMPEMKAKNTTVTVNVYQKGKMKVALHKTPSSICK